MNRLLHRAAIRLLERGVTNPFPKPCHVWSDYVQPIVAGQSDKQIVRSKWYRCGGSGHGPVDPVFERRTQRMITRIRRLIRAGIIAEAERIMSRRHARAWAKWKLRDDSLAVPLLKRQPVLEARLRAAWRALRDTIPYRYWFTFEYLWTPCSPRLTTPVVVHTNTQEQPDTPSIRIETDKDGYLIGVYVAVPYAPPRKVYDEVYQAASKLDWSALTGVDQYRKAKAQS